MSQAAQPEKVEIEAKDILLRRVPFLDPNYVKHDGTVSSFAFTLRKRNGIRENALSVDLERLATYERSIKKASEFRLYSLSVSSARDLVLSVCHDPCPKEEPDNNAHTLISGTTGRPADCTDSTPNGRKDAPVTINERLSKLLARASQRVNYPDRS